MKIFVKNDDTIVDGYIDLSWLIDSNGNKIPSFRRAIYTSWDTGLVQECCTKFTNDLVRDINLVSTFYIVGNSDTNYNIIQAFNKLPFNQIELIRE